MEDQTRRIAPVERRFLTSDFRPPLRTPHAISAVVAEIAVAGADGDGAAVVAGGGVELEQRELLALRGDWAAVEVYSLRELGAGDWGLRLP